MRQSESQDGTVARDAFEMGVYLSVVLVALIVSFEGALDDGGEVVLIWSSAMGLSLAHIFAFRLAQAFGDGIGLGEGWRSIGGMFLTAFGVALLASIPYAFPEGSLSSATLAAWLLMAFVGIMAYLAARSRGWSMAIRFTYAFLMLLLAASISIVKYFLTH